MIWSVEFEANLEKPPSSHRSAVMKEVQFLTQDLLDVGFYKRLEVLR